MSESYHGEKSIVVDVYFPSHKWDEMMCKVGRDIGSDMIVVNCIKILALSLLGNRHLSFHRCLRRGGTNQCGRRLGSKARG